MLDIGFSERDIRQINTRSNNLYNFKKLYQYFQQSGIDNEEFIIIVKTIPNIYQLVLKILNLEFY